MNQKLIGIIVLALVLAGAGYWYWQKGSATSGPAGEEEPPAASIGAEIFEKTENPVKGEVPETNPFGAGTNPFNNPYKNPLE